MYELRWNPLLCTYSPVATQPSGKPALGGSAAFTKIQAQQAANSVVAAKPIAVPPPIPKRIYHAREAYGHSEEIVVSAERGFRLLQATPEDWQELFGVLAERTLVHSRDAKVKAICVEHHTPAAAEKATFRLTALPWLPQPLALRHANAKQHSAQYNRELFQDIINEEKADGSRIVFETEHVIALVPYFAGHPHQVMVLPKKQTVYFAQLSRDERTHLGIVLAGLAKAYDRVLGPKATYQLACHQGAVNVPELGNPQKYFRLHFEWAPPAECNLIPHHLPFSNEEGAKQLQFS